MPSGYVGDLGAIRDLVSLDDIYNVGVLGAFGALGDICVLR